MSIVLELQLLTVGQTTFTATIQKIYQNQLDSHIRSDHIVMKGV